MSETQRVKRTAHVIGLIGSGATACGLMLDGEPDLFSSLPVNVMPNDVAVWNDVDPNGLALTLCSVCRFTGNYLKG